MKERPILFSGPMVNAILENRKTQTRRVVKPQPERDPACGVWFPATTAKRKRHYANEEHFRRGLPIDWSPYGVVGDRLWVREAWQDGNGGIYYRADGIHPGPWKPAIHMPRWASRITLEITGVRVERLQDISNDDARAEGVPEWDGDEPGDYRGSFRDVWDSINGKRHPWSSNPWVWVREFKRIGGVA